MKRKDLQARLFAGALSFSMVAGMCVPSVTVLAAEDSEIAVEAAADASEETPEEAPEEASEETSEETGEEKETEETSETLEKTEEVTDGEEETSEAPEETEEMSEETEEETSETLEETEEVSETAEETEAQEPEEDSAEEETEEASNQQEEETEYQYVYAGLTWAEYWENEAVYHAGSSESSSEEDERGELDKGAFDAVSRATTNHGLHRGSYQCTAVITMKDGTKLDVAYYTGTTTGILTNGEEFSYDKSDIASYEVTGLKYVPVKVAAADYEAFKEKYAVVENGGILAGGFSENKLTNYTDVVAEVTEHTNGLKTAVKGEDGSFRFSSRVNDGTDSGLKDAALKTASDGIVVTVKDADGSYGEFLRVDLTGDYGDLGANMQTVEWTYYGDDSTYTNALQTYGTKFAADNWMHKSNGIQLGLTDSLRCRLPEGTDGTGYWTVTVHALGYADYTIQIQATKDNIVVPSAEEADTSVLEAAIAKADALKAGDYTAASWANLQTELQEAKDELANVHTQATVDEAVSHLNSAMDALVRAEAEIDITALSAAIKAAEALKSSDYTAASWAKVQTALTTAKKILTAPGTQAAADASAKELNAAVRALVKETKAEEPKTPAVGTVSIYDKVQYKVTGTNTVTANVTDSKSVTSVTIPDTIAIDGVTFQVTAIADKAFSGCTKLKTVSVGKNVTTIGSSAFAKCTSLTKVSGCAAVTAIGSSAFSGCTKLTTVKGLIKATSIGSKAFYNCKKLTTIGSKNGTVTLAKVKTIGNSAFQNCKAMTSFTSKSAKLSSIGKKAFYGDSKLAAVSLKTGKLTSSKVGSSAFKGIKKTCTFKVPSGKIASYKKLLKNKGAGSSIKVKKL